MAPGWNLVGFPDAPTGSSQVDSYTFLSTLLAESGGHYAAVDAYTNGSWLAAVDVNGTLHGSHFNIQPGLGYFVNTDTQVAWQFAPGGTSTPTPTSTPCSARS